ncbi:pyridoxal phosphate-dependent aminotransferase [Devosia sp. ZB163]|uniref:pyridoxal phosphate-dependent aminotransferase n=1 Tax=Devosia sp. ZB163 TaxID=3025938 RepID=UPI00235FC1D7|nr:pyridoxal phosphate-dependent aminotransferase [Devosia sp. ZB163]MDC9825986.1 pyridoxal phosphate-dependent aminotransferase [Devosia sp. ZB163]
MRPILTPLAQSLPSTVPFTGPEALERRTGVRFRARVGANESGFGPSPRVIETIAAAAGDVWMYGDPEVHDLRQALGAHLGIPAANIAIGEGIDGLHCLIARLITEPGDVAVTSLGAYPTFNYHVAGFGGRVVAVPYSRNHEDLAGLADAARRERAKVIYLSNPDNPMGTWWSGSELERFVADVPEETLILLDEAYCETAPAGTLPPLDIARPNLIRTRTFSKAYGLAGMRVGYAIGEATFIRAFDKVRNHFGVTRLGQAAAIAALADQDWLSDVVARVAAGRERLYAIAQRSGLASVPSATNFVAVDCGRDGDYAMRVLKALEARGVFVRKPMAPGLDRHIRITIGRPEEMDVVAEELPAALRQAAEA